MNNANTAPVKYKASERMNVILNKCKLIHFSLEPTLMLTFVGLAILYLSWLVIEIAKYDPCRFDMYGYLILTIAVSALFVREDLEDNHTYKAFRKKRF